MSTERAPKDLSIAIVGAGIGGLAVTACLRRFGMDVQIYEQAAQFARVGAGIQMTPNAMMVLRGLGLEEKLREIAFEPGFGLNRDHDTGAVSNKLPIARVMQERYGAPFLLMHRADLHAALASLIPAAILHRSKKLAGLKQDAGGVTLDFTDGTNARADVVVAADGVHSLAREIMLGKESPRFTGKVAYRTTFPASRLGDARLSPERTKWWGPDRHIVIYYVTRAQDEIYFVTSQPEDASWMTPESWSAKGSLEELRSAFAAFHPEVRAVLDACPDVYKWGLLERDPLPTWRQGRVVLLGDACHPMTPYMAQGAASALEDAVVLARCLERVREDGIDRALSSYEATRKPRASEIQGTSSQNTWMRQSTDPGWVYGYDAWRVPLVS
ncbi:MAG: FAD-dependent monooxygenase [Xanthobacteraceae bacterium]|nr:FAD-dependent monooxygenase [Xanthobacteraceae bacterium]